jgi:hypothetical protein
MIGINETQTFMPTLKVLVFSLSPKTLKNQISQLLSTSYQRHFEAINICLQDLR